MNRRTVELVAVAVSAAFLGACNSGGSGRNSSFQLPSSPAGGVTKAPLTYADVVDHVASGVVTIRAARRVQAPQQYPFFNDPLFRQFFGGRMPQAGPRTEVERALGSGVIVRQDGYILTNHHVINGAQEIKVDLADKRTFSATLVGSDPPSDLAVLKLNTSGLPVLYLGDSDKVRVGDVVLAIGNPLGIGQTVTEGIISAKGRHTGLSSGSFQDFLQTDAPINQGNSGGALVNTTGALIGINSEILSTTGGNIGIGFAIPSNMAKSVMEQIVRKGSVTRGQLGVTIQGIDAGMAQSLGLKQTGGVLVSSVAPGSAADKAGIKQGDVIVAMNGHKVDDSNTFRNQVSSTAPGTEVTLTIVRNGNQQDVKAKLGALSENGSQQGGNGGGGSQGGELGISVQPLTPEIASQLGLNPNLQGLVIGQVDPTGPAAEAGMQPGDVIMQVNHQPVRSTNDLRSALEKSANRPALVLLNRGGQSLFVSVKPR